MKESDSNQPIGFKTKGLGYGLGIKVAVPSEDSTLGKFGDQFPWGYGLMPEGEGWNSLCNSGADINAKKLKTIQLQKAIQEKL